jgi:hypothetical protein
MSKASSSRSGQARRMRSKWRRFEVLLPLQFNDGTAVPDERIGEAQLEVLESFGFLTFETQKLIGHWRHKEKLYRDFLARLFVDLPDTVQNRRWMKGYKQRWKERLRQLELWMVRYRIDVE